MIRRFLIFGLLWLGFHATLLAQADLERLEEKLRANFPEERALAAAELIGKQTEAADSVIRKGLASGKPDVSRSILRVIGERRASRFVPDVLNVYESATEELKDTVTAAIRNLPTPSIRDQVLIRIANPDKPEAECSRLLPLLHDSRDPRVIEELIAFAKSRGPAMSDQAVAVASRIAFRKFNSLAGLEHWYRQYDALSREAFLEALLNESVKRIEELETGSQQLSKDLEGARLELFIGRLEKIRATGEENGAAEVGAIVEGLRSAYVSVRQKAGEELKGISAERLQPRIDDLVDVQKSLPAKIRGEVLAALQKLDDERVYQALVEALKADEPVVRARAAELLAGAPVDIALEPLLLALEDSSREVKIRTVVTLGALKSPRAVTALMALWKQETTGPIRETLLDALGSIGDRSSLPVLVQALSAEDKILRYKALNNIGRLGDLSAVPNILPFLMKDKSLDIRIAALQTLRSLRAETAVVDILKYAANPEEDEAFRIEAVQSVAGIGPSARAADLAGLFPVMAGDKLVNATWSAVQGLIKDDTTARINVIERLCAHGDGIRGEELFGELKAEDLKPDQLIVLRTGLAKAWETRKNWDNALLHRAAIAKATPDSIESHVAWTDTLLKAGKAGEVGKALQGVLSRTEPFTEGWWNLQLQVHRALFAEGKAKEVVTSLENLLREDGPKKPVETTLAAFQSLLEESRQAVEEQGDGSKAEEDPPNNG